MKRLISALLALTLVLALAGCAGNREPGGTITPKTDASQETITAPVEETTAPAEETTAPVEETAAPIEETTAPTVSLGRMEGGVYTNEYAGFACSLDETWEYYTAEELQDLSDLTQEQLQDSALAEQAGKFDQITDMMAESYENLATINVNYTRLSATERLSFALTSEEALIDTTLQQKDLLMQTYAQAGINATGMEKTQVTFLGEEHFAIHTVADIEGTPYYILQLFRYNLGGQYYVTLTLASFVEDNTASLLDLFYAA